MDEHERDSLAIQHLICDGKSYDEHSIGIALSRYGALTFGDLFDVEEPDFAGLNVPNLAEAEEIDIQGEAEFPLHKSSIKRIKILILYLQDTGLNTKEDYDWSHPQAIEDYNEWRKSYREQWKVNHRDDISISSATT